MNEIVGYIGMYVFGEEADISNVAVSLKHRRKHIAQNMLDYIFDWSQNKKIKNLTLEVRETNVPAIKLYEKNGFKEAGIRKDYYEKTKRKCSYNVETKSIKYITFHYYFTCETYKIKNIYFRRKL